MNKLKNFSDLKIWEPFWGVFVFLLPITSMPLIVKLVHSDVVAAPSAILLPFLALFCFLPRFFTRSTLPDNCKTLLIFSLTALGATALSFFYGIPDFKGKSPFSTSISAVLTLLIGICFYFVTFYWHDDPKRFRKTARLITLSGAVVCLWTFLQALCWYTSYGYPQWMKNIQFFISVGSLYRQRFVGFTLEPSWLAHQFNLLYLPWGFAASITGYSAFSHRWKFITIERVVFLMGLAVLFLTLSRVGYAAFMLTAAFAVFILLIRFLTKRTLHIEDPLRRRAVFFTCIFGTLLLLVGISFLALYILSKLDFRMANIFHIDWQGRSDAVFFIAEKLSLAARFVYWDSGLGVWNRFPFLGVGLGHAGFYMPDTLNDYALRLVEVRRLLFRSDTLLNIKSFWIRIAAETGAVGLSCFLLWYLQHFAHFLKVLRKSENENLIRSACSWMGCFVLIAFLLEGFSLDTFALPYLWFSLGFCRAAMDLTQDT